MAAALLLVAMCVQAAGKRTRVYVYGFAASFNDSTVYFTDIQTLDSATVAARTHFLYGRDNYSYQLRDYLKTQGCSTPTCVTAFALKRKDIEKKYMAMKKKYANGKYTVKHIAPTDFSYMVIMPDETTDVDMLTKAERKELKTKAKAEEKKRKTERNERKREGRPTPPAGGMPGGQPGPGAPMPR